MLESILHVLHAQALYDTPKKWLPFICILFSGYVIAWLQDSENIFLFVLN